MESLSVCLSVCLSVVYPDNRSPDWLHTRRVYCWGPKEEQCWVWSCLDERFLRRLHAIGLFRNGHVLNGHCSSFTQSHKHKRKSQRIPKQWCRIYSLGTKNVWTKTYGNTSYGCLDISVWTKVVDDERISLNEYIYMHSQVLVVITYHFHIISCVQRKQNQFNKIWSDSEWVDFTLLGRFILCQISQ